MDGLNELTIIGNVVRDAELKNVNVEGTPTPRCKFSVAVNETRGNRGPIVTYFDIVAWREYAVKIAPWVLKGRRMYIKGAVRLNQYSSNGVIRSAMQIHDPKVIWLDKKPTIEVGNVEELDEEDDLPFC